MLRKGSKVRCVSISDAQSNWGGNDSAKKHLVLGQVYTLAENPAVYSMWTHLFLAEVPGRKFNSVQFKEVEAKED